MKKIHQLSIFLENKSGRLNEVLETIAKAQVRIIAATVADTSEFGILRLLTTDSEKAYEVLRQQNISTNRSEVLAIKSESTAGLLASNLKHFAHAGISIEYMYAFATNQNTYLIVKANDIEAAQKVALAEGLHLISNSELSNLA